VASCADDAAKVGKKSMVENMRTSWCPALTSPASATRQNVRTRPLGGFTQFPRGRDRRCPCPAFPGCPFRGRSRLAARCPTRRRPACRCRHPSSFRASSIWPELVIAFHQHVAVLANPRLARELLRREIGKMPHRERHVEEKWLPCRLSVAS
jgi:hypothetical protein